ncbi:MAG: efflux RND transporter permease subunit [Gammaproteobacteria bacterium]|jgi:multidrug efflux pump|nr:efflux RND transporter permease subunit [Gammaproteobacteria bacterium]
MNVLTNLLGQRKLILASVVLLGVIGLDAWQNMNRQEDPAFPYRYGFVTVQFPGADVAQVERLVIAPLEQELAQVEFVDELRTTVRAGFGLVVVVMQQDVYDTASAWERVRIATDLAAQRFPDEAQAPEVDDRIIDAATVVYGITGSNDQVLLQNAAERLRDRLFSLPGVARIRLFGNGDEQLTIGYDDAQAMTLGISPTQLAEQIQGSNRLVPAGYIQAAGRQLQIRPQTDLDSVEQLRELAITLPDGNTVPLGAIAEVSLTPSEPARETAWLRGTRAVVVAVVAQNDVLNVEHFGVDVRARVEQLRTEFAPLQIQEMFYQPQHVHERLQELGQNLLLGVLIVVTILLLVMGLRLGLLVGMMVPLVTLTALAIYALGGGVLQQMAVAGMVIALGMLVDNAIVMSENIQWHIDQGKPKAQAARHSVRELLAPLGAATGTTVAVFLPMVLASGDTADFTRAVPVMIILMLIISYVYAVLVTPIMAVWMLNDSGQSSWTSKLNRWVMQQARRLGEMAVLQARWVLAAVLLFLLLAVFMGSQVKRDFFPATDREQLVVDIYFAEGTPISITTAFGQQLAHELRQQPGIKKTYLFTGNSGPKFYYNLNEIPSAPHLGRVVVLTASNADVHQISQWVRNQSHSRWPQVQLVPRELKQGPPTPAPIEVRVTANDWPTLVRAVEQITVSLRNIEGSVDVRHDLGIGIPTLRYRIDDRQLSSAGMTRAMVGDQLARQSQGLRIGSYRAGRDTIPLVLRSAAGEYFAPSDLDASLTWSTDGNRSIPLAALADATLEWQPAVRHHFNLQPSATVFSELLAGYTYDLVYQALLDDVQQNGLPVGVQLSAGGAQRSSGQANSALFRTLPLGLLLLLFFLLLQFHSFRRVGLVLMTIPLALAGVVPGLLLTGYPFGFMALLGVIALAGIVVNNAIVLLDVVDQQLAEGHNLHTALIEAVARRTRPVLLTTATTVAGLYPLTTTASTLWPPMAWTIISGLLVSTLLTLVVLPAMSSLLRLDCKLWQKPTA